MNRAYSLLEIKSVDAELRTITGIATSPTPDRMGDIVEPLGVQFKNPLPLLLYHDSKQPVGQVTFKKPTAKGVEFTARIPIISEPASLKDRVDTAWASIKAGLLKGVSIGFRAVESSFIKDGGTRFLKTEVLELSLVAVPANADATIANIKSYDQHAPAASGTGSNGHRPSAGVTASTREPKMTNSESLTAAQDDLRVKSARLQEIELQDESENGLDADLVTERDTLAKELPILNGKVARLKTIEASQANLATGIGFEPAAKQMAPAIRIAREAEKKAYPAWMPFVRATMAKAAAAKMFQDPIQHAQKRWGREMPEVVEYLKASPGTTDPAFGSPSSPPAAWGSQLVPLQTGQAFVDQLMPATIIGRLNLVPTPFLTRIVEQISGATIEWVGQAAVKPVGEMVFTDFSMPRYKVAGIVVISDELARSSQPDAEELVRRSLTNQIVKFLDTQFIDVSVGGTATNPASITNGVTPITASGTDINSMLFDFNAALGTFDGTDLGTSGLAIVTTPALARGISMMITTFGARQFPEMTPTGGSILGYPVIVSNSVPSGDIVFIKQDAVRISSDRQIMIDVSNQATLDMNDGNGTTFNLWQRNCIGLRAEEYIAWLKDRAEAVMLISSAAYAPTGGSV